MARVKNPNRDKAFNIYKEHKGDIKLSQIADMLSEKATNIRSWKKADEWDSKLPKVGAPKGNSNAKGNKGNRNAKGAPKGNVNAIKHGGYMSNERFINKMKDILPKSIITTMNTLDNESEIDKLWRNIIMLDAKIANAYKIIDVKSSTDHTIGVKKQDEDFIEYDNLFAIEKEVKAGSAIAKMKDTLCKMLKTYNDLIDRDLDIEEQKARIKKIKQDTAYIKAKTEQIKGEKKDTSLLQALIDVMEED
ncbi:MAG: phage terminase small subunit [Paraclostridium sp.]